MEGRSGPKLGIHMAGFLFLFLFVAVGQWRSVMDQDPEDDRR